MPLTIKNAAQTLDSVPWQEVFTGVLRLLLATLPQCRVQTVALLMANFWARMTPRLSPPSNNAQSMIVLGSSNHVGPSAQQFRGLYLPDRYAEVRAYSTSSVVD